MWALLTIFGGSTVYLLYNIQVETPPRRQDSRFPPSLYRIL